jgi:hypothetical protein
LILEYVGVVDGLGVLKVKKENRAAKIITPTMEIISGTFGSDSRYFFCMFNLLGLRKL